MLTFSSLTIAFLCVLLFQCVASTAESARFLWYVRSRLAERLPVFLPQVALIAPCKGLDQRLDQFLASIFTLDYPSYEIVFVVETDLDPVVGAIQKWQSRFPAAVTSIVIAGESRQCGQKVHNLMAAVSAIGDRAEILAFVDSDVCLTTQWLRSLVAPLQDPNVGATTGYRWYVDGVGLSSLILSLWNAPVVSGLHRGNAAWGGSMAIRRAQFVAFDVRQFWLGSVSDDFGVTRAVKAAGRRIQFVPACLVATWGDCGWRRLLEFTTRQVKIARIYSGWAWRVLFLMNLMFNIGFWIGIVGMFATVFGETRSVIAVIIGAIYAFTTVDGLCRVASVWMMLPEHRRDTVRRSCAFVILTPLISLLYLYNYVASTANDRITWRGITYELKNANELRIVRPG